VFLRRYVRTKSGKRHTYFALVESSRTDAEPRQSREGFAERKCFIFLAAKTLGNDRGPKRQDQGAIDGDCFARHGSSPIGRQVINEDRGIAILAGNAPDAVDPVPFVDEPITFFG
jgi:hypothetical protein